MNSPEPATESAPTPNQKRRRGLLLLAVVVLLAGAAWFAWWYVHARWYVSTEDAYAGATVVQVTSEVAGTVRTIHPRETEWVTAGQPLIELDPADARIAMDAALADLGATVRQVRGTYPQTGRLQAQIAARETDLARARDDYRRRQSIAAGGAVSAEELAHAREVVAGAEAALRAAREELNVALAQTGGIDASRHPQVMRAIATGPRGSARARAHADHRAGEWRRRPQGRATGSAGECRHPAAVDRRDSTMRGWTRTSRKCSCSACASGSRSN